jgi:hypothetical protein
MSIINHRETVKSKVLFHPGTRWRAYNIPSITTHVHFSRWRRYSTEYIVGDWHHTLEPEMTIPDLFILGANLNETFPGSWILTHVVFCFKKFHSITVAYPVEYSLPVTEIKLAWKYLLLIPVLTSPLKYYTVFTAQYIYDPKERCKMRAKQVWIHEGKGKINYLITMPKMTYRGVEEQLQSSDCGTRWKSVVSHTSCAFTPDEQAHNCALNRNLGGPQNRHTWYTGPRTV